MGGDRRSWPKQINGNGWVSGGASIYRNGRQAVGLKLGLGWGLALARWLQALPAVMEITHRPPIRVDNAKAGDVDGPKLDHVAWPMVVHDLGRENNGKIVR